MVQQPVRKRNKAERINNFIDSILSTKNIKQNQYGFDVNKPHLTETEYEFYRKNSFERNNWSGSRDFNNPKIDLVILGFKVICEKLIYHYPKYQSEYNDVLRYLAKEERSPILVGNGEVVKLTEKIVIRRLDLNNRIDESYSEIELIDDCLAMHLTSNSRATGEVFVERPLNEMMNPFGKLNEGVYEFQIIGQLLTVVFAIQKDKIKVSNDRRAFLYMIEDFAVLGHKRAIRNRLLSSEAEEIAEYTGYKDVKIRDIYEGLKAEKDEEEMKFKESSPRINVFLDKREEILHLLSNNKTYFENLDKPVDEEYGKGYDCNHCKDGGCVHCEHNRFIQITGSINGV